MALIFNEEEIEKNYIVGQVVTTFFENATNFYKVLLVNVKETNSSYTAQEIVVTGTFGQIQEDELYRFYGDIVNHPRYGEQLKVDSYQQDKPTSLSGLINYLSSDKFPGIGKKTAESIIDLLGEDAIDKIIEDPEYLLEIKGLNDKKRKMIVETLKANYGMEQIIVGLNQYGFGNQLAFSIYQFYKEETLKMINENPYQLVEDIEGVGFKKADALAERIGIKADSPQRIRAAIVHELFQSCLNTGNTYMEAKQLLEVALMTLESSRPFEINPASIADEIIHLSEEGIIIQEGTKLYEKSLYFSEVGITTSIKRLLKRKKEISYPQKEINNQIKVIEKLFDISYGESQTQAIKEAITSPFFILTGGPGTGKTTVVNGIVTLFAELNGLSLDPNDYTQEVFPILLAAPTGRAAKRMNEMTGLSASTIHRLLGLTGREKEVLDEAKDLEGGLLIVDEMSMVDTWLANTLLKSIPNNMQVIFVGDKDQLPSVGPGQVLTDLLAVKEIPKRELTDIYRQEDGSTIISLAHSIKTGKMPQDLIKNQKDRSFIPCSVNQMESVVKQVVLRAKDKGFTSQEMQVLAPMYRGKAGIDRLNQLMQEILNDNEDGTRKEVKWLDKVYRIGDKVLHLVNSPEFNVFNGDMGEITGITYGKDTDDKIDEMVLLFDETEVTYKRQEWNKFTLAYACSIHKSQGSEFKMVVLPLVKQYGRMLQRKLIYTAVTRSKDFLILLGEVEAFQLAIESEMIPRQTTLKERLVEGKEQLEEQENQLKIYEEEKTEEVKKELANEEKNTVKEETLTLFEEVKEDEKIIDFKLTFELVNSNQVDPMIGMKDVTPYDYM
ncbi:MULTISPECIES: ATP-dependent RecD-like DNA helicase [Vagococcus]|uniref:ATP-dependent RecD2 DNA helicase n=1 Tax=Vagococcus fluvialis bH819 TaxID=1255619 RepID=A0A1X6WP39_9ENTE|nr:MULTISPECIES: ATP-dependent RecD-like DNA helicase [Vagococcus]SLM85436.1 RecD-like DNA helicase YrrC [Vagococcus fluvialis bH819]HCM89271.1 ATP-dependent RecD-like DNA helicase [Vagococcus sp.]